MRAKSKPSATKKAKALNSAKATRKPKSVKAAVAVAAIARWRIVLLCLTMGLLPSALAVHLARIQVVPNQERGFTFLQEQGEARTLRSEKISAYRGLITDRNGELLAVSTPVKSLIANPQRLDIYDVPRLAKALGQKESTLRKKIETLKAQKKQFTYLDRHLPPHEAAPILALGIPGVSFREEYRRYYPATEYAAHIVGFTNIDGVGQEGMELALESVLVGKEGEKQYIKDLKGNVVKDLGLTRSAQPGQNVSLSIDLRLQYLAYRELKTAVAAQKAKSGSVVMLDVTTGEVLAMANQPSYNPNDRSRIKAYQLRNRAITDLIEPGSTVKPFTVMAALETGRYHPGTKINTSPGHVRVGRKTFLDPKNYGVLDLTTIIQKSSQVGISKLALDIDPDSVRNILQRVGLGQSTGVGFPGESIGVLPSRPTLLPIERATLAFGHGLSVTPMQLAQAYIPIATSGKFHPVSLLKDGGHSSGVEVLSPRIADQMLSMLKTVTQQGGTATRAQVLAYPTAGKTGTAHKVDKVNGGYSADRYVALFAGIAPVNDPRIVTVVIIDEPSNGQYYGGEAAAPVFAKITEGALRLMNVAPLQHQEVAKR